MDALIQLFAEVLDVAPETLNDNTSPDNTAKWDSLAAMHLVAAIEDKFQVRLSTKEIMKMKDIGLTRKTLIEKNVKF